MCCSFEVLTGSPPRIKPRSVHVDYFGESVASGCLDTPCVHVVIIFSVFLVYVSTS